MSQHNESRIIVSSREISLPYLEKRTKLEPSVGRAIMKNNGNSEDKRENKLMISTTTCPAREHELTPTVEFSIWMGEAVMGVGEWVGQ